jgi:hypothetical protein
MRPRSPANLVWHGRCSHREPWTGCERWGFGGPRYWPVWGSLCHSAVAQKTPTRALHRCHPVRTPRTKAGDSSAAQRAGCIGRGAKFANRRCLGRIPRCRCPRSRFRRTALARVTRNAPRTLTASARRLRQGYRRGFFSPVSRAASPIRTAPDRRSACADHRSGPASKPRAGPTRIAGRGAAPLPRLPVVARSTPFASTARPRTMNA